MNLLPAGSPASAGTSTSRIPSDGIRAARRGIEGSRPGRRAACYARGSPRPARAARAPAIWTCRRRPEPGEKREARIPPWNAGLIRTQESIREIPASSRGVAPATVSYARPGVL